jgi:alginate O-acetyltransferase complex protein AlgI
MTFVQTEFLWFFTALFAVYWAIPNRTAQNLLLAVASAAFYGWVHPWFLILLYATAGLDYVTSIQMEDRPQHRKLWLWISMIGNIGMLAYFKYCDFFIENVAGILDLAGVHHSVTPLGILLPAGISFYTFQSMAYTIDVYRKEMKASRNLLEYMLAVSFFAHLVAGPVQRASNLLMQAQTQRVFSWDRFRTGLGMALWGAFKKVVIADTVASYVDKIFLLQEPSGAMIWAATLGFTVQIYADFSGYTDIARGVARMLGWDLMENFKLPYIAQNPSDFWRRWHISFSSWIRDYIYISLGGSRGGAWAQTRALWTAMLISGLWHGASWTFVLWGAYHAALQSGYRITRKWVPAALQRDTFLNNVWGGLVMFGFTVVGWLIFRETDIHRLLHFLTSSPLEGDDLQRRAAFVMLTVTGLTALPLVLEAVVVLYVLPRIRERAWFFPVETSAWAVFALGIFTFIRMTASDFIYFQF